jgi:hypothetical protein
MASDGQAAAARERVTVVFILSANHSGSTWLNLVLGSHPWAFNLGEYFRPFLIPGHVACRLCDADGLDQCTVLHGIEAVDRADAFHFAAERSGKRVLIDASKRPDWCAGFLGREDIAAHLIHLVRHPCGYVESQSRRAPDAKPEQLLELWEATNREIETFVASSGAPSQLVCYDDLADDPQSHLPALCAAIGQSFDPAALNYWEVPHHGLGGNGPASVYLRNRPRSRFLTGDDAFYADIDRRPLSADRRWKERLTPEFRSRAVGSPYAVALRERLGGTWET